MRMMLMGAVALACATIAGAAQAQTPSDEVCRQQAQRLALGGENLADFMAYCTARQTAERPMTADRWRECQSKTSGASGRGADSSHTPQEKRAMQECLEGRR